MSGSVTSPTACFIDASGIHAPAFTDILTYLQSQMTTIFGSDIYIANDSQDGQMLGIFATAISDTNSMAVAVYNSFSPSTALGVGLSQQVKINGIARLVATNSTVDLTVVGVAGTVIISGVARDASGNNWTLPISVVIPSQGQIDVTATAVNAGAIIALPHTVTQIGTPTLGWQTVTNPVAALPGAPLESDATLRQRQTTSTMLPSVTALDGMIGAVADVTGVTRYAAYENDTNIPDSNGVPGHSVSFVVEGGDSQQIANAIAAHKTPGAGTYGTTQETVVDTFNVPHTISFFRPSTIIITVQVHLNALQGYTSDIGTAIINSIVAYILANPIGGDIYLSKVTAAANLVPPVTSTFNITSILLAANSATPAAQDINIPFNSVSTASNTTVSVTIP